MAVIAALVFITGCSEKESYFQKGEQALESGNYDEAFENYSKAIMEDEKLNLSYRGAGICAFMTGDYEKAEDYFVRALQESRGVVGKEELDLSYYLAETYVCLGKNDEALETYTNILNFDEDETEARVYRGIIYASKGETDKAEKDFSKAVEKDDTSIEVYYQIYNALSEAGDKKAEDYLKKGLKCEDESKEGKYMKGCLYKASGDLEKALSALQESKTAGYGKASFTMGEIYEQLGDLENAIACYDSYLKVANASVAEYSKIIECQIAAGDIEKAKAYCETAVANAKPSELRAMKFEQITAMEKMGDFAKAKELMSQYLADYPDDEKAQRENEFLLTR